MATAQRQTDEPSWASAWGALVLLAVLPYLNALRAGFTFDDFPYVRENAAITGGFNLTEIIATPLPVLAYLYRPLTVLTFAANEAVAPGNALGFHLVNVALHAAVTVLVYCVGVQLFTARAALIAAALFAVHPLHTEAVTSIVGRAELLAALFGLLALHSAGAADAATDGWRKRAWYAGSLLCFTAAVFSKENAVMVLPLVLLYRAARRGEPLWRGIYRQVGSLYWVPYALCIGVFLYFRFLVVGTLAGVPANRLSPLDNILGFVPWSVRVPSALGTLWDYFGLLNLPITLSADYSFNQVPVLPNWIDPRCLAGVLLCAAGVIATVASRPAVGFSAALPFVAMLLTANVLFPIGTVKAERLLYLPSVGWMLVIGLLFDRMLGAARYRVVATAVVVLMLFGFTVRTWVRNEDWQDNFSLFASTARSAPDSTKAQYNLGAALQQRGLQTAAVARYRRALAISRDESAQLYIGVAYEHAGDVDDAIGWYRQALGTELGYHKAHTNLCHVLLSNRRFADANTACRNGLRYWPADANLLKGLGLSLVGLGETDKGIDILGRSLALAPGDEGLRVYIASLRTPMAPREEGGVL